MRNLSILPFLPLCLASFVACSSSSSSPSDVEAARGGSAGSAGSAGGSAADPCGATVPADQSACPAGLECTWADRVGRCDAEGWFVGVKATDGPLGPSTTCQPIGVWHLTYSKDMAVDNACQSPFTNPDLTLEMSSGGVIGALGELGADAKPPPNVTGSVSLGADGCTVTASRQVIRPVNQSEEVRETWTISLVLAGDSGSGSYMRNESGLLCGGTESGKLIATRM